MLNKSFHILFTFWLSISCLLGTANGGDDFNHVEVAMRMIGHELLLSTGDSTSRVLPVLREGNRYKIQFDTEFEFEPDVLIAKADSIIALTNIASAYRIEMQACDEEKVMYSFEIGPSEDKDLIPCRSRTQPEACYLLYVTLIAPPTVQTGEANVGWFNLKLLIPLLFILGVVAFLFRRKPTESTPNNPDLIPLGKYVFDKRNMLLSYENTTTELTSKESDLLTALHSSANNTLERDVILNTVWGDDGDYVGRTLDVFISKLRKKLEADPTIKIANIRGVGYKLILNDTHP